MKKLIWREAKLRKKIQKEITKEFDYKFIIINPESEDFDMNAIIGAIFNHINEANKNQLKIQLKNL